MTMTIMTLGGDAAAIATLLSAIGTTQAEMTAAEVDLSYSTGVLFGIAGATDPFFTALCTPTVIARLTSEDAMHPSAIIFNRTDSASGALCVQVAFTTVAQVPYFVAASNWIAGLSNNQLGALEVAATCKQNMIRVSGGQFQTHGTKPQLGISGRGVITTNATQCAAAGAAVSGAGKVAVDTSVSGP
jgi:hypothetical protein